MIGLALNRRGVPNTLNVWGSSRGLTPLQAKVSQNDTMSNFDLLDWSKHLKIPIKNVLSRAERVPHNYKLGRLFIYNLACLYE